MSSSAETSISSNFSGSSHSTNFSASTSEVESDLEANSSEAGPWSLCRKSPTSADIARKIKTQTA